MQNLIYSFLNRSDNSFEYIIAVFFVEKLLKAQYSKDIKLYEFNKLK